VSPVRRRALSAGRRKKWLIPLLLLALLAALAGGWLLLRRETPELPLPQTAQSTVLCDRAAQELRRVAIENPYDAPYALIQTENGWQMEGDAGFVFRETMLEDMVNNACQIITEDTVADLNGPAGWTAADFGLAEGCVRVTAEFTDGAGLAFRIGVPVAGEIPGYYFQLEGDSRVFIISQDVYEAYSNTRMALHEVSDPALNGSLIDRIAFTGSQPLTLEKQADGWYMTAPFRYPLSDAAMDALLKKLEGLRFAQYVGRADALDLAALGLQPPLRTLTLDIAPSIVTGYDDAGQVIGERALDGYQLIFALGDYANEVSFYCLYRGEVVKATVFSAGFLLTQGYDGLLLAAPFNAPTNDLQRLVWRQEGAETAYDISLRERVLPNNDLETDENGSVVYDVIVSRGSEAVDSDAFFNAYRSLVSLRTEDRLPADYTLPDAAPVLEVTLERSASARTVALYPYDALHRAVAVDGVARFLVEKGWAENIVWP